MIQRPKVKPWVFVVELVALCAYIFSMSIKGGNISENKYNNR
ncbi:hypothetical protein SAMN05661008_00433 [Alkalithermobacter thermoalcaliphilus JW-YL-7 = DSM 7308]|uniref:Uncharacterized protein n=1 Tax=Alkalithermobacter thermoalcaliphilus JW-YL-7 = DSM 7308 TaxID=1121328 RepID=A0A150FP31_CLOPD|nr:hypothetical protein JWYL7_0456 [[Clostridium] paradoxum JW-YL-7 = DSM 7308]SHK53876.1 hypothetical protein SAMN05661008_00433 [[Clostridium] paradoxum JW-YL-7 = DSM 7308]